MDRRLGPCRGLVAAPTADEARWVCEPLALFAGFGDHSQHLWVIHAYGLERPTNYAEVFAVPVDHSANAVMLEQHVVDAVVGDVVHVRHQSAFGDAHLFAIGDDAPCLHGRPAVPQVALEDRSCALTMRTSPARAIWSSLEANCSTTLPKQECVVPLASRFPLIPRPPASMSSAIEFRGMRPFQLASTNSMPALAKSGQNLVSASTASTLSRSTERWVKMMGWWVTRHLPFERACGGSAPRRFMKTTKVNTKY